MGTTRRLAAILAADVAGYSRLMAADEAGTLARFNALRGEIIEPAVARFHGTVVGSAGDSLLVEFPSVVDAVTCAVAAQAAIAERNTREPEDRRIVFRMGVNLGDVIADGTTIHGDGVNVAARLEKLADPGSVVVASAVHDQVKGKLPFGFTDLGEHAVKNIAEPVRAFLVSAEAAPARPSAAAKPAPGARRVRAWTAIAAVVLVAVAVAAAWLWPSGPGPASGPPTVAVLPLANISGDPALDHLAEGVTEGLIARFARSPLVRVIARTSSDVYKDASIDIRRIGREIGARYILEGGVQTSGSRTRIVAQLIDTADGGHVWAEQLDSEAGDALAIQDDVIERIVTALAGTGGLIDRRQYEEAWAKDADQLGEYDISQRGQDLLNRHEIEAAIVELAGGLERFPGSALLRVRLGYGYLQRAVEGLSADPAADIATADRLAREALAMDGAMPLAIGVGHALLSEIEVNHTRDFEQALRDREKALQIFGSDYGARAGLAYVPLVAGRPEETIRTLEGLTPAWPFADWAYAYLSWAHFAAGDLDRSIEAAMTTPIPSPTYSMAFLAAALVEAGRLDEARRTVAKIIGAVPTASLAMFRELHFTRAPSVLDRELAALREAGLPE